MDDAETNKKTSKPSSREVEGRRGEVMIMVMDNHLPMSGYYTDIQCFHLKLK